MSEFIWPGATIIISVIFMWMFKVPLSTFLKRVTKISRDGVDAGDDMTPEPTTQAREADLAETQRIQKAHAESIEQQARQIADLAARLSAIESLKFMHDILEKRTHRLAAEDSAHRHGLTTRSSEQRLAVGSFLQSTSFFASLCR